MTVGFISVPNLYMLSENKKSFQYLKSGLNIMNSES
jgi:hypothetical protein